MSRTPQSSIAEHSRSRSLVLRGSRYLPVDWTISLPKETRLFDMAVLNTAMGTRWPRRNALRCQRLVHADSNLVRQFCCLNWQELEHITIPVSVLVPPATLGCFLFWTCRDRRRCMISSPDGDGPSETIQASLWLKRVGTCQRSFHL